MYKTTKWPSKNVYMVSFKDMETFNTWLCSLLRWIILILIFSLFVYYNLSGEAETSVALKKNQPAEGRGAWIVALWMRYIEDYETE